MAKNYYTILGILPTATPEDIRGAYRKRAKELHPDHYGKNSSPFLEVQEAYGVLSDPKHRRKYDREQQYQDILADRFRAESLRPDRSRVEPLRATGHQVNFGEINPRSSFQTIRPSIEEVFNRIWSNFDPTPLYKSERLQNLCMEIVLSPDETKRGGRMEIILPARVLCTTCGGHGNIGFDRCYHCMGSGDMIQDVPVLVQFPPNISDGSQKTISLRRLGIRDVYVTILFRISRAAGIECL
jgi:molecular chaperone DnaJ